MLSVVVYGRNDAHGYNLHKRAAISLNCIAEMLSDGSDEIIFVDYNTPDDCPTFPEAIHDTLTAEAIRRLRILRVRPAFHRRYAGRTRLVCLEPPSRNIAVRRANPDNRWILSTNTDMVFVPRRSGDCLSSVAARLADGFYHLPRFEVPESLWDGLPRMQPQQVMASLQDWGRRFRLNEIAYGGYDNLYDAPGDFQLFLRRDLFAIGGFDERMILGWHVDSNMARRMKLFRGEVGSALDFLFGYHCGHVRQVTSLHAGSGTGTQNSLVTFVEEVEDPVCREQLDSWGAPEAEIEEIRLGRGRFVGALSAALPGEGPVYSEAVGSRSDLEIRYDPEHVLPHLCNLIHELPRGQRIFFWGDDAVLLDGLKRFLEAKEGGAQILLAAGEDNPLRRGPIGDAPGYAWVTAEAALRQADIVILQYPAATVEPAERRREYQWGCLSLLRRLTAIERQAPPAERRRLIAVNVENTLLQGPLAQSMSCNSRLFTTRLQQGFVIDPAPAPYPPLPSDPAARRCYAALHRCWPFAPEERELLRRAMTRLTAGNAAPDDPSRLALEIAAIAAEPQLAQAEFGLAPGDLGPLAAAAEAAIAAAQARLAEPAVRTGPRVAAGTRLISATDWEDPDWLALGTSYFDGPRGYHLPLRGRWFWERTSALFNLLRHVEVAARPWVLVVGSQPDPLAIIVANSGYRTVCADTIELLSGVATQDWNERLGSYGLIRPNLSSLQQLLRRSERPPLAAVVVADASPFADDGSRLDKFCASLEPLVAVGAYFGAGAVVALDNEPGGDALPLARWQSLFEPEGLLGCRGFAPAGGMEARVPLDAAVRFAPDDRAGVVPGLAFGRHGRVLTVGTVAARWPLPPTASDREPPAPVAAPGADQLKAAAGALLAQSPPFVRILPGTPQNLLPFLYSSAPIERNMARAAVTPRDDDAAHLWLAVPVDARWREALHVSLRGADIDTASVLRAIFVAAEGRVVGGRPQRAGAAGGDIVIGDGAALDRGMVMLQLWNRALEIEALLIWGEPLT